MTSLEELRRILDGEGEDPELHEYVVLDSHIHFETATPAEYARWVELHSKIDRSASMTLAEAGELYGMHPDSLRKAIKQGRLAGRKSGDIWLVSDTAMRVAINFRKLNPARMGRPRRGGD